MHHSLSECMLPLFPPRSLTVSKEVLEIPKATASPFAPLLGREADLSACTGIKYMQCSKRFIWAQKALKVM